jgi:hypothetical protein
MKGGGEDHMNATKQRIATVLCWLIETAGFCAGAAVGLKKDEKGVDSMRRKGYS